MNFLTPLMNLPEQAPTVDEMRLPEAGESYRHAAVLILVYPKDGEDHVVFMRRTDIVLHHKGQISLPGGGLDATDPDIVYTALREAQEELGVEPEWVDVLGVMPEVFARVSGFLITPVVGRLKPGVSPLSFVPSPEEVAEVIEVPLQALRDPSIHHTRPVVYQNSTYNLHYYNYGPYEIWGATGRILHLFFQHELSTKVGSRS